MQTFSVQLSTSELPQSRKVSAGVKIAPCVGVKEGQIELNGDNFFTIFWHYSLRMHKDDMIQNVEDFGHFVTVLAS